MSLFRGKLDRIAIVFLLLFDVSVLGPCELPLYWHRVEFFHPMKVQKGPVD